MKTKRPSKTLAGLALAALFVDLVAAEAPVDFRVIPAGEFRSWDGRPTECAAWICLPEDGARIVADLNARQSARVIDYEHSTLIAKRTGQKAEAAGWFKQAEWRDDGVWLVGVDWTALAAKEIVDKRYRYVSPVFGYDPKSGRVQTLFHAALTNDPGLDGLTDLAALAAELFLPTHPPETEMDLLKKLLAALGLQDTATEAEALSAVAALKTNVATLSAQVAAPDPARWVPIATLSALQGEHATLQTAYAALQADVAGGKLDKVVADGLASGKLTPATESWARDLGKTNFAALSTFLEMAPVIAAPGKTQTGGKVDVGRVAQLSAEQQKVCELMGVSPEEFAKNL
ncbi:phage protease [Azonexus sp.]|uniref:phage protease n=1 Tax=Azonexus sp. TaxID=1872668 RepID=UPI0035B3DD28